MTRPINWLSFTYKTCNLQFRRPLRGKKKLKQNNFLFLILSTHGFYYPCRQWKVWESRLIYEFPLTFHQDPKSILIDGSYFAIITHFHLSRAVEKIFWGSLSLDGWLNDGSFSTFLTKGYKILLEVHFPRVVLPQANSVSREQLRSPVVWLVELLFIF